MQFKLSIFLLVILPGTVLPVKNVIETPVPPREVPYAELKKGLAKTNSVLSEIHPPKQNSWYKNKTLIYLSLLLLGAGISAWKLKGVLSTKLDGGYKPKIQEDEKKSGGVEHILRTMPPSPSISALGRKIAAFKSQIDQLVKDFKNGNYDTLETLIDEFGEGFKKTLEDAIKLIDPLAKPQSVVDFLSSLKFMKGLVEENGHRTYKQIDSLIKKIKNIALEKATADEAKTVNETYKKVRNTLLKTLSDTERTVLKGQKNTKDVANAYEKLVDTWGTPVYAKAIVREYFTGKLRSNKKKFAKLKKEAGSKIRIGFSAEETWEEDSSLPPIKKLSDFDEVFRKLEALRPADGDRNTLSEKPWESKNPADPSKVEEFTKALGDVLKKPWQLSEDEKKRLNERLDGIFIKSSKAEERNSAFGLEGLIVNSIVSEDSGLWWASQKK